MKKYLFIGGMFFPSTEEEILKNSKGMVQNAANKLQWLYVRGLESNLGEKMDILNSVYIGRYPKAYKKMWIKSKKIKYQNRFVMDVGFVNLPVLATYTKYYNMKHYLYKWWQANKGNDITIFAYGMFSETINILKYVKKLDCNIKTVLIILDLPEFMNKSNCESKYYTFVSRRIHKKFNATKNTIDFFVTITEQMKKRLGIEDNSIVIEGMVDQNLHHTPSSMKERDNFIFLYAGGLNEKYGVRLMIQAFKMIKKKNAELWICGDGPMKQEVLDEIKADDRIRYLGNLPQKKCLQIQQKVSCLINPRLNSELTKYSFPSKMMEYLTSGTPVIASLLEGMPEEYRELFYNFGEKDNDLYFTMDKVINLSEKELEEKAQKANDYIQNNKDNYIQINKLLREMNLRK